METECPNCGHQFDTHRTERQMAGERVVALDWALCGNCGHVALANWSFVGSANGGREIRERRRAFSNLRPLKGF
jgi:ribosomal protein L32